LAGGALQDAGLRFVDGEAFVLGDVADAGEEVAELVFGRPGR
jgi:hypothetical protein